jgi:hypothetical protein
MLDKPEHEHDRDENSLAKPEPLTGSGANQGFPLPRLLPGGGFRIRQFS